MKALSITVIALFACGRNYDTQSGLRKLEQQRANEALELCNEQRAAAEAQRQSAAPPREKPSKEDTPATPASAPTEKKKKKKKAALKEEAAAQGDDTSPLECPLAPAEDPESDTTALADLLE